MWLFMFVCIFIYNGTYATQQRHWKQANSPNDFQVSMKNTSRCKSTYFFYTYIFNIKCHVNSYWTVNTHSHKFRIDCVAHKVYRCLCVWIKSSVLDVYTQNVQLSTTSNKKASTFIQGIHTVQSTQRICERMKNPERYMVYTYQQ